MSNLKKDININQQYVISISNIRTRKYPFTLAKAERLFECRAERFVESRIKYWIQRTVTVGEVHSNVCDEVQNLRILKWGGRNKSIFLYVYNFLTYKYPIYFLLLTGSSRGLVALYSCKAWKGVQQMKKANSTLSNIFTT